MHCPARNKTSFTSGDVHRLAIDGERHHAFQAVNGLVVMRVRMGRGNFCARRNGKFKHGQLAVEVFAFEQEANFNRPGSDDFIFQFHAVIGQQRS